MYAFPIHCHKPAVQKLQVHLENGQRVCFDADNAEDVAEEPPQTTLTAFFSLCSTDNFAQTLLYVDVPKYFTFAKKKWRRRLRGDPVPGHSDIRQSDCLGRVYTVHPNNTECYHLRLLLHIVKGSTSFADLRTVDGVVCTSYKEACKRRGLLENDDHWHSALAEASLSQMPRSLRDMFAVMIHMCIVTDPLALWNAHKEALSQDFLYRRRRLTSQNDLPYSDLVFNEALIYIEDTLLSFPSGKHLPEYGIPVPDRTRHALSRDTPREILAEQSYDQTEMTHIVETPTPSLTPDQSIVYDTICQLTASQEPENRPSIEENAARGRHNAGKSDPLPSSRARIQPTNRRAQPIPAVARPPTASLEQVGTPTPRRQAHKGQQAQNTPQRGSAKRSAKPSTGKCMRCGDSPGHPRAKCRASDAQCANCGKIGHYARVSHQNGHRSQRSNPDGGASNRFPRRVGRRRPTVGSHTRRPANANYLQIRLGRRRHGDSRATISDVAVSTTGIDAAACRNGRRNVNARHRKIRDDPAQERRRDTSADIRHMPIETPPSRASCTSRAPPPKANGGSRIKRTNR